MLWPSLWDCFKASVPEGADCMSLLYRAQSFMDGCVLESSLWEILYCLLQGNVCVFSYLEFEGWIQTQLKGQWITLGKQLVFKREITERACIMSVCWDFRFYLKLTSCPSVELLLPLCSCLGFVALSITVLIPGVTLSAVTAPPFSLFSRHFWTFLFS